MRNKKLRFRILILVSLLFLSSSLLAKFLAVSFNPEHAITFMLDASAQKAHTHITPTVPQSSSMPTPTPQPSPTAAYNTAIVMQDTFNRLDQVHWGATPEGDLWQGLANTSSDFTIQDNNGRIAGQGLQYATQNVSLQNLEVDMSGSISSFQGATLGTIVRWGNGTSWYEASINGTSFSLLKRSSGVLTTLASIPFRASANMIYTFQCVAFHQQLTARVWPADEARPTQWQLIATDNSLQSGYGGIVALTRPGSIVSVSSFSMLILYALN